MTVGEGGTEGSLLTTFEAERPRLFGLAYRMLGSVADAEDIIQEAYLRWVDGSRWRDDVENPAAFLTTIVSRLAIDRLRSAQLRREHYVGPWLPEPVLCSPSPDEEVVMAESLTMGFLAVLERLGPVERAVFLLHDVFGLPFAEIASVVDRRVENCRQIARRARSRVHADRVRFAPRPGQQEQLLDAFLAAMVDGDVAALEGLLAEDVVHVSDGGADRHAARKPILGRARVARFLINVAARAPQGMTVETSMINGEPGLVVSIDGEWDVIMVIRVVDAEIVGVWAVANRAKLTRVKRS